MGLEYNSGLTERRGNELAETGINLESISVRYYPQFKDKLANFQGQNKGFGTVDKFSRDITVTGEVSGSTGLMAATLTTAITLANDVSTWVAVSAGTNAGGIYMDEATENQTRDGWRSMSMSLSSDPLIT